jgi:hypothetical protein
MSLSSPCLLKTKTLSLSNKTHSRLLKLKLVIRSQWWQAASSHAPTISLAPSDSTYTGQFRTQTRIASAASGQWNAAQATPLTQSPANAFALNKNVKAQTSSGILRNAPVGAKCIKCVHQMLHLTAKCKSTSGTKTLAPASACPIRLLACQTSFGASTTAVAFQILSALMRRHLTLTFSDRSAPVRLKGASPVKSLTSTNVAVFAAVVSVKMTSTLIR